ncbi:MAG: glycosyltransferase family 2 protein [Kiritimatiellae bacterium]|nr:glycosyltransferase family 2 protein [Kiritimatiellia bacterium]
MNGSEYGGTHGFDEINRDWSMTVAVLMTCHNRRETTLRCLEHLFVACDKCKGISFDVWLVDDGSSDGTAEGVKDGFPQVHVVSGDGNLFWAKGMHRAWMAATHSRHYDLYLWLNDDVVLKRGAISGLLADYRVVGSVLVGACSEDDTEQKCSYGATNRNDQKIIPIGRPLRADGWLNGNVVLVPEEVFSKVGMISDEYSHARADYDYAERLRRLGIPFYCSSAYVGSCKDDFMAKMCAKSFWQRIQMLWRPGYMNLHDLWLIRCRYHGIMPAIMSCAHLVFIAARGIK